MAETRILTPVFRVSYPKLVEPEYGEYDDGTRYRRWSVTAIFEPDADLTEVKKLINDTRLAWRKGKPLDFFTSPLRPGVEASEQYPRGYKDIAEKNPEYMGKIIMAMGCTIPDGGNGVPPGIATPRPKEWPFLRTQQEINEYLREKGPDAIYYSPKDIYAGMYGKARISAYVPKKNPGIVTISLQNFQICYDGDPIGASRVSAEDDFEAFETPGAPASYGPLLDI